MENAPYKAKYRGLVLVSAILNLALFLTVWYVFFASIAKVREGMLAVNGLRSLRYFTVLSNLLEGLASVIMCGELLRVYSGAGRRPARWVSILKLAATSAVSVTFIVVTGFLGPVFGYAAMYRGANLWFHLIVPLAAVFELVFCEYLNGYEFPDALYCIAPVIIYAVWYIINILVNGVGEWPDRNDFYGFLLWGLPTGIVIFLGIVAAGWGAGILLRTANDGFAKYLDGRSKKR